MAMLQDSTTRDQALEAYYRDLERYSAAPLWTVLHQLLTPEPRPRTVPYLWRWSELRPQVYRAGELIGTDEAERRVVMLLNPGLDGACAITSTLYAGPAAHPAWRDRALAPSLAGGAALHRRGPRGLHRG